MRGNGVAQGGAHACGELHCSSGSGSRAGAWLRRREGQTRAEKAVSQRSGRCEQSRPLRVLVSTRLPSVLVIYTQ